MADNRTDPQYKLRWPATLRDRITAAADKNHRSVNAEIIARLEQTVQEDDYLVKLEEGDQLDPTEYINPAEDPEYAPFQLTTRERLIADEVVRRLNIRDEERARLRGKKKGTRLLLDEDKKSE